MRAVAGSTGVSATSLTELSARFSGIVLPGDALDVEVDELVDGSVAYAAHVAGGPSWGRHRTLRLHRPAPH